MRLVPSDEQRGFAAVLHDLLSEGPPTWEKLGEVGVTGLVPDATAADLVVACEEFGHHAVEGPVAESIAAVPALLAGLDNPWSAELAAGRLVATLAAPPRQPLAADTDRAGLILLADGDRLRHGVVETVHDSMHPGRTVASLRGGELIGVRQSGPALDLGCLACSAQLLGAGRALLERSVKYATVRTQFGRPIGSFQAVRHGLADVAVALEFARPLLHAAAVTLDPRDVSAAKVACGDAALLAARQALQVHGALGYTREYGLGRWLTLVRVLHASWGTAAWHRDRILTSLGGRP
ncbi:acyl-CoA dehydrogenase family protein [Actinoplanes sp. G11-F43]|uniref:acyl-CoA dehydrogenase family protein n=1 Tax=Actinoplanes sp. G11-F43 TaxID=3424130 RepID=UPI003D34573F